MPNFSDPIIAAIAGSAVTAIVGLCIFAIRHYLYETERLEVILEAEVIGRPDCIKLEFEPHDVILQCSLKIFNIGKRTAHITKITGSGITDLKPKFRLNFYGDLDDPFIKEIDSGLSGSDTPQGDVVESKSIAEELIAKIETISGVLEPNSPPIQFEWNIKALGRANLPKTIFINIYTAEQQQGFSKHRKTKLT